MGRKGWKGLEQHGHARARPAAVMATRWSRAHGELYLRRKWNDGGVVDVEELTVVLWLRGIGPRRSVEGDFGSAAATASRSPRSRRKEMAESELVRRRESGEAWLSSGAQACAPRGETLQRRSAMTVTDGFLKTAIQCTMTMTVSDISTCQYG